MTAESPGPEQYFPAVQVVGVIMLADGQKLPAGQGVGADMPADGQVPPAVQAVHVTADAPPAENELI